MKIFISTAILLASALANAATPPSAANNLSQQYPKAQQACLKAVAKATGVAQDKLKVTDVLFAEAGIGVEIKVPDADAPWSCLSDEKGKVQGVGYSGSGGRL